ncbi:MAG: wax ester/triacylglycerol synthase family O-acyltransferase [Actinomycetota bacterium]|nr:wax ester/triacylglycerol synthase family O-acyltransferase [Actinomycetota bacterium]
MGRGHGEVLSMVDAMFVRLETPTEHMHTAGLFVFDPAPDGDFDFYGFLDLIHSRLHLVPRFRQKLAFPPLKLANPTWIDDEQFDISYHVRHATLPSPGRIDQLLDYVERLVSRPLDRDHPLWELYVIEGLEEGRVAYFAKTHHAMIDGITGIDIATLLLDFHEQVGAIPPPKPWVPSPRPSDLLLAWSAVQEQLLTARGVLEGAQRFVRAPGRVAGRGLRVGRGLLSVAAGIAPGPDSPLNRPIGTSRRFAVQRLPLADVKAVKETSGTTVNDVVLAIVGDATGRFLRERGDETRGLELKVMVPVSMRSDDERLVFGNRVSSLFVRLPVYEMDPVDRLMRVHADMRHVKESGHAVGADFLISLSAYAPPTLIALAARLASRTRLHNFVVTNVPGPQATLYSLGMRLLGAFPLLPLVQNHSYAVGVTSLDGWLNFGFTADADTFPDLENVTGALADALGELVKATAASR